MPAASYWLTPLRGQHHQRRNGGVTMQELFEKGLAMENLEVIQ